MTFISWRQSFNSKIIESITMLSQSGFWLKVVQSKAFECSALPRHVSHWCHDSQVVINHLHNQIYNFIQVCQCINIFTPCIMCVQYTGEGGDTMSTSGDIMSTLRDVQYFGGYHDACGGQKLFNLYGKPWCTKHPQCTHGIPHIHHDISSMYSWNPLMYSCTPPPPMYSWYPPMYCMVSPQCTNHPQYTGHTYRVFTPDEFCAISYQQLIKYWNK